MDQSGQILRVSAFTADEWTTQFLPPAAMKKRWPERLWIVAIQPVQSSLLVDLPAPTVEVLSATTDAANQRQLQLRFVSPRNAAVMLARLSTAGQIVAATVAEQPMAEISTTSPAASLNLGFYSVAGEGVVLTLTQREPAPVTVLMEDHTYALPVLEGMSIQPRPAWMMPSPTFVSDATLIRQTVTIP
ncbi:MAG: hypothetical protein R3E79_55920 [Caldilineaceae bacterium]